MKPGWESKKLGDVYDVRDGTHDSPKYQDSGFPLVTSKNLKDGSVTLDKIKYISKIDYLNINKRSKVDIGDILFAMIGTIGNPVVVMKEPDFAIKNVALFKVPEEQSSAFLKYYLEFVTETMKGDAKGSTQKFVGLGYLRGFEIHLPELQAQKQIVAKLDLCFEAIDKAKANAAKNLENAKALFQSKLNDIFSQQGKGWVEKKLGEIGKASMCKRIFKNETLADGETPFYKIGTFGKEPNAFISKALYNEYREKYRFPKKGDILISASGTIGRTVVYDGEPAYFQDSNIVWIDNDEKSVTNRFLFALYESVKWGESKGTTIKRLYNSNLESIEIHYPKSFEEQKQIVKLLGNLKEQTQSLESKYQTELKALEELKKSILQKAFAGELH